MQVSSESFHHKKQGNLRNTSRVEKDSEIPRQGKGWSDDSSSFGGFDMCCEQFVFILQNKFSKERILREKLMGRCFYDEELVLLLIKEMI